MHVVPYYSLPPSQVWELLDDMKREGLEPDAITYNSLIHACVQCGDFPRALSLLSSMRAAGFAPNVVTFTSLIDGLGKAGRIAEAENIFKVCGFVCRRRLVVRPLPSSTVTLGLRLYGHMWSHPCHSSISWGRRGELQRQRTSSRCVGLCVGVGCFYAPFPAPLCHQALRSSGHMIFHVTYSWVM